MGGIGCGFGDVSMAADISPTGLLAKPHTPAYTGGMTFKRLAIAGSALFFLLAAGWTGWWFYAAHFAIGAFQDWAAERRADGWDVGFARIDTGGYPMAVRLSVAHIGIAGPGRLWSLSSDAVDVSFPPWRFDLYSLEAQEPVRFVSGALAGSRETPLQASGLTGRYHNDAAARAHRLVLTFDGVSGPQGIAADTIAVSAVRPFSPARTSDSRALTLRAEAVGAVLPGALPPPLSPRFPAAILDAEVFGPEPPAQGSTLTRLEAWRAGGGKIDVGEIALVWEDLNLQGDGTVTVDAAMRPLAAFSVRAVGIGPTARRAEEAGLIDSSTRRYIELGAGILSFGSNDGGTIKLPVAIQDGVFYLGPAPLGEVPPIIPGFKPPPRPVPVPPPTDDGTGVPPPPPTVSDETLNAN